MTTFPQIIDRMVAESRRPDLLKEICSYANQALRELHMEPTKGNAVFFRENRKEAQLITSGDTGVYWDVPKPSIFQGLEAARYDSVHQDFEGATWAREQAPGRNMNNIRHYYYRAGGRFFFHGAGGVGSQISLSYFEFVPNLRYYATGTAPATYDDTDGWAYLPEYDTSDSQRELAQSMVTNWILLRWQTVAEEGIRAKVYKRLADTERARTCYSMYTQLRQGLYSSEAGVISGGW